MKESKGVSFFFNLATIFTRLETGIITFKILVSTLGLFASEDPVPIVKV